MYSAQVPYNKLFCIKWGKTFLDCIYSIKKTWTKWIGNYSNSMDWAEKLLQTKVIAQFNKKDTNTKLK